MKLGEATLKRFLMLYRMLVSDLIEENIAIMHLSTCELGCALTGS